MSPNTWLLPLAIVASTALGALVASYIVREPSTSTANTSKLEASALDELARSQQNLAERVDALERTLRAKELEAPAVVDGDAPAPKSDSTDATAARRVFEPAPGTRTIDTRWIETLDKRIATALVERALTPFDPGVAEPVRIAGAALRAADEERTSARTPWLEQRRTFTNEDHALMAALRTIDERHALARDEALRQLEAALDVLSK